MAAVRKSKFRSLEGSPFQNRDWYNDVRCGSVGVDCNPLKANGKLFAVPWVTPGTLAMVPLDHKGAIDPETIPLIVQEDQLPIIDFAINPFDDFCVATSAEDGRAFVWKWPEGNVKHITQPVAAFVGHSKRLLLVDFHPKVEGILLTGDAGKDMKLWDVNHVAELQSLPNDYSGQVTSVSWNLNGSLMATSAKDNFLRIVDPRANAVVAKAADHQGVKAGRLVWCGKLDRIVTTGFSKSPINRDIHMWDPRNLKSHLCEKRVDQSSSLPLPIFDEDTSVLFFNGKGEGIVNFFELEESSIDHIGKYQSVDPAAGVASFPKTSLDVLKCEVFRMLKLTPKGQVIPIKFTLARADSHYFQDDIYPPTWDLRPLTDASSWFKGHNQSPNYISLDPTK